MRRTPLVTVVVALILAATGCGGEDKKDEPIGPVGDAAESPAASPSQKSSEKASGGESQEATPFDDKGNEILRGTVRGADTPQAKAVVDAWFAFWDVRASSFGNAKVDPKLGSVAAADAVSDVVSYVAYLRSKKLHTVGDTTFGVSNLEVDGKSATLTSCGINKSIDRRADGSPAEEFTPFFTVNGTLTQVGGQWRVVKTDVVGKSPCKA
jgi:hypothetical protein